jgi:anaerobic selenocysteine-containing dehydrogenase
VSWDRALDLLSGELRRVYTEFGPEAVYGGSYGWASAGRFHHAQSQVHRFLNCLGGYVRHVNSYSLGTSTVLLPYVVGDLFALLGRFTAKSVIAEHTELVVASAVSRRRTPRSIRAASPDTTTGTGSSGPGGAAAGSSPSPRCATTPPISRRRSGSPRGRAPTPP